MKRAIEQASQLSSQQRCRTTHTHTVYSERSHRVLCAAAAAEEYFLSKRDINIASSVLFVRSTGECMRLWMWLCVSVFGHTRAHISLHYISESLPFLFWCRCWLGAIRFWSFESCCCRFILSMEIEIELFVLILDRIGLHKVLSVPVGQYRYLAHRLIGAK